MINGATPLRVPRETRRKTGIGAFGKFLKNELQRHGVETVT